MEEREREREERDVERRGTEMKEGEREERDLKKIGGGGGGGGVIDGRGIKDRERAYGSTRWKRDVMEEI